VTFAYILYTLQVLVHYLVLIMVDKLCSRAGNRWKSGFEYSAMEVFEYLNT